MVRGVRYIALDLEWNQAMSPKARVYGRLPFRLTGEIIQIGAVKLDADFRPETGDGFMTDVKPRYFKRMHYKVKKLTGFDKERLQGGIGFAQAMREFREWCGGDCVFLTWGPDDKGIMEQNIILHDLDPEWLGSWINLQVIYNVLTESGNNQKSLKTAMEHFGLEQAYKEHDALGDAYNAALICSKLDMPRGLTLYEKEIRAKEAQKRNNRRNKQRKDAV